MNIDKLSTGTAIGVAALLFSCLSAAALETRYAIISSEPVAVVWKKAGGFCGIANWNPAVAKCDLSKDGKMRTVTRKAGGVTPVEALVTWSDKAHSYTYKAVSGPLPVTDYVATFKVVPHGKGSMIIWSSHYKLKKGTSRAKANEILLGIYKAADVLAK